MQCISIKLEYIMPIRRLRMPAGMGVNILTAVVNCLNTVNQSQKSIKNRIDVQTTLGIC